MENSFGLRKSQKQLVNQRYGGQLGISMRLCAASSCVYAQIREVRVTLNWGDLETIREVSKAGSMSGAARALGVHPTTIARRIEASEEDLGEPLFLKQGRTVVLTPLGKRIMEALAPLGPGLDEVTHRIAQSRGFPVRVATTENGARILAHLMFQPPATEGEVEVDLLTGNTTLDLMKGQADLALRVVEPTEPALVRKKMGLTHYGLYASEEYLEQVGDAEPDRHVLLLPGGGLSTSREAIFLRTWAPRARVALRSSSLLTLAIAAERGLGVIVLPTNVAVFHPKLCLMRPLDQEMGTKASWLVVHQEARVNPRVRAVFDHLAKVVPPFLSMCAQVKCWNPGFIP